MFLEKIKNNPIAAALVAVGVCIVGLANTGAAIETLRGMWRVWTTSAPALETSWQGTWTSQGDFVYAFSMRVLISSTDSARGGIRWRLVRGPSGLTVPRIGAEATEWVSGTYDRQSQVLSVRGDSASDTTLIVTDEYRFTRTEDSRFVVHSLTADSVWTGVMQGTVIVTEVK